MPPQNAQCLRIDDFNCVVVNAHNDLSMQPCRQCGVIAVVDLDRAVILNCSGFLREVGKTVQRQIQKKRFFFLKHLLDLPFHPSMNPQGGPALLPVHQPLILLFDAFKPTALQSGVLGVLDRIFNTAFAVRVGYAGGIGHNAVMSQDRSINRIQMGFIKIRFNDAFFEVVQNDVAGSAAKVTKSLFMQLGPCHLAGCPDHLSKTAAGVLQCHDKQAGTAVGVFSRNACESAKTIVHLGFLAGAKLQPVILDGILFA